MPITIFGSASKLARPRYYARGVALQSSPENPQPLRVIARAVRSWVERLGAVWVEAQLIEINRRSGTRTIFLTLRDKLAALGKDVSYTEVITTDLGHLDGIAYIAKAGAEIASFLAQSVTAKPPGPRP